MISNINKPTLSVIMPNYNHASYIGEALEAILGQSFKPSEVIVIDDASTDNSINVIEKFIKRDPIVKLLKNEYNAGVVSSVNRGLQHAVGDYIFFTAADDKVLPGLFEKSMRMLELYPQAGLCCSDVVSFNNTEASRHIRPSRLSDKACYLSIEEVIKIMVKKRVAVFPATCIHKRSAWIEGGGYIPELKWHSDWLPIQVIVFRYGICYIPEPLFLQRILKSSYSFIGGHNWKLQKEVAVNIISFLELPSYSDIRSVFKQTCNLAIFGMPMLYVLFRYRKNWEFISLFMILRLFIYEFRKFMGLKSPLYLKRGYYRFRKTMYNKDV